MQRRNAAYMAEHHNAVPGKMNVCLQPMGTDTDGVRECTHSVLRILCLVSSVGDGLRHCGRIIAISKPVAFGSTCRTPRRLRIREDQSQSASKVHFPALFIVQTKYLYTTRSLARLPEWGPTAPWLRIAMRSPTPSWETWSTFQLLSL